MTKVASTQLSGSCLLNNHVLGHRLKSGNTKTSAMFEVLSTPRRIILSGTPIQNDLSEFHAMVLIFFHVYGMILNLRRRNSAIPTYSVSVHTSNAFEDTDAVVADYSTFRKTFEVPILRSRAPDCTAKERAAGDEQTTEVRCCADNAYLPTETMLSTS